MIRQTASSIEDFVIKLFERLIHDCSHAPDDDTFLSKLMSGDERIEK